MDDFSIASIKGLFRKLRKSVLGEAHTHADNLLLLD